MLVGRHSKKLIPHDQVSEIAGTRTIQYFAGRFGLLIRIQVLRAAPLRGLRGIESEGGGGGSASVRLTRDVTRQVTVSTSCSATTVRLVE